LAKADLGRLGGVAKDNIKKPLAPWVNVINNFFTGKFSAGKKQ